MRQKVLALGVFLLLGGGACHRGAAQDEPSPTKPHTLRFGLYSAAQQVRSRLEARGAAVSRIEFIDRAWSISFALPASEHTPSLADARERAPARSCFSAGGDGTGIVACQLYSTVRTERAQMIAAGWEADRIYFDPDARKWAFRWMQR